MGCAARTMSTTNSPGHAGGKRIEVIPNEDGTVTFVSGNRENHVLAPTEWITVDADAVVDARDHQ